MRFASCLLVAAMCVLPIPVMSHAEVAAVAAGTVKIHGVVRDAASKPLANARVVLECTCLSAPRETTTNAKGLYAFAALPPGTYTVRVLGAWPGVSRVVKLRKGMRITMAFRIDPSGEFKRLLRVKSPVGGSSVGRSVSMEEFRNIPAGASRSIRSPSEPFNREAYSHIAEHEFRAVKDRPLSTFAADVDTASYANVRRFLDRGERPPIDAVRVEELINYFDYDYKEPKGSRPVAVNWEIGRCPWAPDHVLARIGLQTKAIAAEDVPPRNLVFLIDVSGSMDDPRKLPLLQRALHLLVDQLRKHDTVSIVVYAGAEGVVLEPTRGDDGVAIRKAIDDLEPGGTTNGAAGIRRAYALAKKAFVRGGINRVILATDGDFNVGVTSEGELTRLIEKQRESKVFLSVLGFGIGNYQDTRLELLADNGNGNYAYIDSLNEARKVLVEEAGATLHTVAKDVKLQVEFNPEKVERYRLIGYENRLLADEDFEDDTKDAGDMGAGHSVTALYELVPVGARTAERSKARKLRYQSARVATRAASSDEWLTVKVRYKPPEGDRSRAMEVAVVGRPKAIDDAREDFRFASAVAAFGMVLRASKKKGKSTLALARKLATGALGPDRGGHRRAFVDLIDEAADAR